MIEYFIRITPDNAISTVKTDKPHLFWYYSQINADSIEIVRFNRAMKHVLIVDEEGLLKSNPKMNMIASMLAGQMIVGTVLIAREDLREGEPDIVGFNINEVTAARLGLHYALMNSGLFEDAETVEGETGV